MAFNFCGQPFLAMEPIFAMPPRCALPQQRCHCRSRPNCSRYGPSRHFAMDKLIEEARRQVEHEQAIGAINDSFAVLDSIINAIDGSQHTTNHANEKIENGNAKLEEQHENSESNHVKDQPKSEEYCPTFPDFIAAVIHELTKEHPKETTEDEKKNETPKTLTTQNSKEPEVKEQSLKKAEMELEQSLEKAENELTKSEDKSIDKDPAQLLTRVNVNEDLEQVQIKIELSGYKFKPEHLDVQLINDDVLAVSAEDGEQKFERRFRLSPKCQLDKIMPKLTAEENKQVLMITVPKVAKKSINIPICTADNE